MPVLHVVVVNDTHEARMIRAQERGKGLREHRDEGVLCERMRRAEWCKAEDETCRTYWQELHQWDHSQESSKYKRKQEGGVRR